MGLLAAGVGLNFQAGMRKAKDEYLCNFLRENCRRARIFLSKKFCTMTLKETGHQDLRGRVVSIDSLPFRHRRFALKKIAYKQHLEICAKDYTIL
jgi:hypothetical protein